MLDSQSSMCRYDLNVLLDDPWSRMDLRDALKDADGLSLRAATSWEQLMKAIRPSSSIAVVDPSVGDEGSDSERWLGTLLEVLGGRQIVLFTSPTFLTSPRAPELRKAGFALWIVRGTDGHDAIRRTAAMALAAVLLRSFTDSESEGVHPAASHPLWSAIGLARGRATVRELARSRHMSVRTLRRQFAHDDSPPPAQFLGWIRLFRAYSLGLVGARSADYVAREVGYQDPSSLYRLSRSLLGCPLNELWSGTEIPALAVGIRRCVRLGAGPE